MLLRGKVAVVYGAAGHIGAAVARAFAADGATVYLAGRTYEKVQRVADAIREAGGKAEAAEVDALDRQAIEDHLAAVVEKAGGVDITINAIGIRGDLQGTPLTEMTLEDFALPVEIGIRTHFLTATAAARHMAKKGSGVILTLSSTAAGLSGRDRVFHRTGGFLASTASASSVCGPTPFPKHGRPNFQTMRSRPKSTTMSPKPESTWKRARRWDGCPNCGKSPTPLCWSPPTAPAR